MSDVLSDSGVEAVGHSKGHLRSHHVGIVCKDSGQHQHPVCSDVESVHLMSSMEFGVSPLIMAGESPDKMRQVMCT